jgi:glycosyltransferase involved in cell wall biosynthesis
MKEPLVSYCIITYNQERYIRDALESAISQDYENMEIIVSDDNSKDNTYNIIQNFFEQYNGRFNIIINRNPQNLFITGNLNKAIELSHGKYIIFSAGDDVKSGPSSVSQFVRYIKKMGVLSLTSNAYIIDENSRLRGTLFPIEDESNVYGIDDYLRGGIKSCGAARIIDRDLLDIFGMLNNDCQTEDSTTNLRAILTNGLGYVSKPLVNYRVDGNNVSIGPMILNKFNPCKIHKQYLYDLENAYNKGLVDSVNYTLIKNKIDKYLRWETGKRIVYNERNLMKRLFSILKFSVSFQYTFLELYAYLKYAIVWSLRRK